MNTLKPLKNKLLGGGGSASGILGGIGSMHNVCHSLCVTVVSALAFFGITMNILPLMFLQTYQRYFWWAAFAFTVASLFFYLQQTPHRKSRDRNFIILNAGLLLFGVPFSQFREYLDFFRFAGGSIAVAGILLFLFGKKIHLVARGDASLHHDIALVQDQPRTHTVIRLPRLTAASLLVGIVAGSFLTNQYMMYRAGMFSRKDALDAGSVLMQTISRMKFTPFDVVLAKERMDKDSDGMCDTCGMSIQQCIDNGQLDCAMGSTTGDTIGVLGTQHIHADFKVYVNSQALDFSDKDHMGRMRNNLPVSSFIHVDSGAPLPERAGDVLHMHATNVPLWLFFRSIGMELSKDYLRLADGKMLKNTDDKTLKFFVNGRQVERLDTYVFTDLDKILISYGGELDVEIQTQLNSITDFADKH